MKKKRGVCRQKETRVPRGEQTQSAARRSKMSEGVDLGACVASFSCRTPSQDSLRNVVFFRRRLWRKNNEVVFSFFFFLLLLLVVSRGTTTRPARSCPCRSIVRSISSKRVANARLEDVRNDGYEYALSLSLSFFCLFFSSLCFEQFDN